MPVSFGEISLTYVILDDHFIHINNIIYHHSLCYSHIF